MDLDNNKLKWLKGITPNHITMVRLAMIPVLFTLIYLNTKDSLLFAFMAYFFACVSDFIDGYVARHSGQITKLGKLLDPLADKVMVSSVLILLVAQGKADPILVSIIISREFAVSSLRSLAATDGVVISANNWGKIKTFIQMSAIGFLVLHHKYWIIDFHELGYVLLWGATIVTLYSGVNYFREYYNSPVAESTIANEAREE